VLRPTRSSSTDLLAEYARRFDSLEMDSAFVRFPSRATVAAWTDVTPPDFRFTVHMSREVTHGLRLGVADVLWRSLAALEPLGTRLRCVLFTTPPSMPCDADAFRSLLSAIPHGLPTAWEFHHASWLCPEIVDLLVERGSAPVVIDRGDGVRAGELLPGGDLADKWNLPLMYVRLRRDRYTVDDIMDWGDLLAETLADGRPVCAFFKPSPDGCSYATALSELLTSPVRRETQ
jgi:uncharacterized protein YecE (DUF72 family)